MVRVFILILGEETLFFLFFDNIKVTIEFYGIKVNPMEGRSFLWADDF